MFKPIVFGILGLVAVVVIVVLTVAATRPDTFRVRRSIAIKAAPERIFSLINDFRRWESWSPYEKMDPNMRKAFHGAESGPGAIYEWAGNRNAGKGSIEIVETTPPRRVALLLKMSEPFDCRNDVEFTLEPEGEATRVTWAMEGPSHFVSKVVSVFINMDRMVGGQFEEGLANLKVVAEKAPADSTLKSASVGPARAPAASL